MIIEKKWNTKFNKICTLYKFHIYSTTTKHRKCWDNYMHLKKQVAKNFIQKFLHTKKWNLNLKKKTCNIFINHGYTSKLDTKWKSFLWSRLHAKTGIERAFYQPWLHIKTGYEMKELEPAALGAMFSAHLTLVLSILP